MARWGVLFENWSTWTTRSWSPESSLNHSSTWDEPEAYDPPEASLNHSSIRDQKERNPQGWKSRSFTGSLKYSRTMFRSNFNRQYNTVFEASLDHCSELAEHLQTISSLFIIRDTTIREQKQCLLSFIFSSQLLFVTFIAKFHLEWCIAIKEKQTQSYHS